MESELISRSSRQLDFVSISKNDEILVGASNLINSGDWNGALVYYNSDVEVPVNEDIYLSANGIKLHVPVSIATGCFLDTKKVIVGNDCGMLAIYSVDHGEREDHDTLSFYNNVCSVDHDRSILTLSVTQDCKSVASAGMDLDIKLWDVEMFIAMNSYKTAHSHFITSLRYKPESSDSQKGDEFTSNLLMSSSLDGYCILWDSRQQYPAQVISKNHKDGFTTAEWFDSGDKVSLGCEDGTLRIVDIRQSTDNFSSVRSFKNYINKIAPFHRNSEKYVAVSADSRKVLVFRYKDDSTLEEIYSNDTHKDYVKGLAWISKDETLLSCGWDSRIIKHKPFNL